MRLAALFVCLVLRAADILPQLSASDIVRSADRKAGAVAPGEIVILFAANAGPDVLAPSERNPGGKVSTKIGDTRVLFDGIPAPMVYSIRGEVSAVVPYEVSNKKVTRVILEYRGLRSAPVTLPVVASTPALFTLDSSGTGQAAMLNETGCCNSPRNPAVRGSIVSLYATGEGQTTPPGITGLISAYAKPTDYPAPRRKVRVTVGGQPAEIVFSSEAPHTVTGFLQVNFRVPYNAPLGDAVPLALMIGDTRSPEGLTMAVRTAVRQIVLLDLPPAASARLNKTLTAAGYHVTAADQQPVDLVISSLQASEQLSSLRAGQPRAKLIAMTASLDPETLRAADLLGAQAVLTETATFQSILHRVRELLRPRVVPYVMPPESVPHISK